MNALNRRDFVKLASLGATAIPLPRALRAEERPAAELAPPDKNGTYVSLEALNAIDALGAKAAPLLDALKAMPRKDPNAAGRASGEPARSLADILRDEGGDQPDMPKRPRRNDGKRTATWRMVTA